MSEIVRRQGVLKYNDNINNNNSKFIINIGIFIIKVLVLEFGVL